MSSIGPALKSHLQFIIIVKLPLRFTDNFSLHPTSLLWCLHLVITCCPSYCSFPPYYLFTSILFISYISFIAATVLLQMFFFKKSHFNDANYVSTTQPLYPRPREHLGRESRRIVKAQTPTGPAVRQHLLDTARKLCSWTLNNMLSQTRLAY